MNYEKAQYPRDAECKKHDPDIFFPEREKGPLAREAIRICLGCPVRQQCLEGAIVRDEPFGVWGGMTTNQRRSLIRRAKKKLY